MFNAPIRRSLLLLSVLASPAMAQGPAAAPPAAPAPAAETMAANLDHRLDALQNLLNAVRDAEGEPLRQAAMERHWTGMQDYMAASLKLAVREPGTAGGGAADCRMVGSTWTGLSFPGQIRSDDYLKAMQAHQGDMRRDLIRLHAAHDPEALNAALQSHWRNNYQFLQTMRGQGWMFGSWTPAKPGDRLQPDPASEGAQLTQTYCSACHAVPNTRLHTAAEWTSVMSTMIRHIALSDSSFPICVRVPSDVELKAITDHLTKYAR